MKDEKIFHSWMKDERIFYSWIKMHPSGEMPRGNVFTALRLFGIASLE
jgi:hypothetical protein